MERGTRTEYELLAPFYRLQFAVTGEFSLTSSRFSQP